MATIRAYTDIEQSRKLAEILSADSADMQWFLEEDYGIVQIKEGLQDWGGDSTIPCWSLVALLGVIPYPTLHRTISGWRCDMYNEKGYISQFGEDSDNPIDGCYEMIIKLHELNLL